MRRIKRLAISGLVLCLGLTMTPLLVGAQEAFPTLEITEDTVLTEDVSAYVLISANGVTFDCDGHTISGDGGGGVSSVGVSVTAESGVTVKNCVIERFFDGVMARGSSHSILDNQISNVDFGIVVRGTEIVMSGNSVQQLTGIGVGISAVGVRNRVEGNTVSDITDVGIHVVAEASGGNMVAGNTLSGGRLGLEDPHTWYLNTYENNTCSGNSVAPSDPAWICSAELNGPFVDDDTSVFQDAIEWLFWKGITVGCNPPVDDEYCPADLVTRGHMAVFISRAVPLYLVDPTVDHFGDDDGRFFEGGANRLFDAGITVGCGLDRFCGDRPLTREEFAVWVVRALDLPPTATDYFVDDEDSPYEDHINRIAEAGITVGCNPPVNDEFCPQDTVTRGQTAAFIRRAWGP